MIAGRRRRSRFLVSFSTSTRFDPYRIRGKAVGAEGFPCKWIYFVYPGVGQVGLEKRFFVDLFKWEAEKLRISYVNSQFLFIWRVAET